MNTWRPGQLTHHFLSSLCSCPASSGVFLNCCYERLSSEDPFCTDGIDNDGDGLIDCKDPQCALNQGCILAGLNPKCDKNPACKSKNLAGLCCPTTAGVYLDCCKQALKTEGGFCADGLDNDGNGKIDCNDPACSTKPECANLKPKCQDNKFCKAKGLTGACCPTTSGKYLDCCHVGASATETGKCFE